VRHRHLRLPAGGRTCGAVPFLFCCSVEQYDVDVRVAQAASAGRPAVSAADDEHSDTTVPHLANTCWSLARALRLSIDERAYLFDLAQQRQASGRQPTVQAPPESLARLLRDLSPLPSMLVNHRFDILAWNPEMAALMVDFGALPVEQRNTMWLCMLYPPLYDFYRDRERVVRERIADLRAAWAAHPQDTALGELIEELTSHSTEFARLWPKRCVRVNGRGLTPLLHPRVGPLTVEYEVLTPLQEPDQRVIICRAADPASQAALDALAREAQRPRLQVL
jgi:hypothetical protein